MAGLRELLKTLLIELRSPGKAKTGTVAEMLKDSPSEFKVVPALGRGAFTSSPGDQTSSSRPRL